MVSELCDKAFFAFVKALHSYLKRNAPRTISIASIIGQNMVKVSVRALMREHDPSTGFTLFMDVLATLEKCGLEFLKRKNIEVTVLNNEIYFIIPLEVLKYISNLSLDKLVNYFKQ